ncbi:putative hydroxybutyrate dehydrogenase [Xylariaceae sp. FL0255]|nr:putative hydroxybutyrate dehydrogenase [Xylariaceae sp. FL0255]
MPKTVLITGCSDGGLGSSLALAFHQHGFHVFATARDPSRMGNLEQLSNNVTPLTMDVLKSDDIEAVAEKISQETGGTLDYLVNNAGRNHFMPVLDEDLSDTRELFAINLLAPIAVTQAFAPMLSKAKGTAVYIVSTVGHLNIPYMGTYSASKMSLEIVADTLRLELAPFGVNVVEVVTGGVKSLGQTYFSDSKLPSQSHRALNSSQLYKSIESIVKSRAQGKEGMERMDATDYATAVVDDILNGARGRIWHGIHADAVRMSTTSTQVSQSAMDARAVMGTGLDMVGSEVNRKA